MLRRRGVTELAPGHFVLPPATGRRLSAEVSTLLAKAEDRASALKDYAFMFTNAWLGSALEPVAAPAQAYAKSA
jgi:hypothetical protein